MSDPAGVNEPAPRVQRRTRTRGIAADRLMPMEWIDRFVIALAFPARSRRHAAKPPRLRWRCDEHKPGKQQARLIADGYRHVGNQFVQCGAVSHALQ